MNNLEEYLKPLLELINKKDYINAITLIEKLEAFKDEELNKYLKVLMDLFSVITSLTREQRDSIKSLTFEDFVLNKSSNLFSDIIKENEKRYLILHRRYATLIKGFNDWESSIYQDILKALITLANEAEKKHRTNLLNNIYSKNYEQAKVLLENKSAKQNIKKIEKVTLVLLEQIMVLMHSKELPKKNEINTDNYIEAISNNDFELALKLTEDYNIKNNFNFNQTPNYLLLRDICKVLRNIKNYKDYCKENKVEAPEEENELVKNKYDEIKKYGLVTIKCKTKNKIAKILKSLINYPGISSMVICDGKTLVLKYSPYIDSLSRVPELMKKANDLSNKKKTKEALEIYLEVLKCEGIKAITYSKVGLCFVALKNYSKAIEYLTIAMELGKKENQIYDFHALITRLEGKLLEEDIKPHFSYKESKFNFCDKNDNFGLGDLTDLTNSITESGLDVESACLNLGIPKENIELIKLVYAKEFFSRGEEQLAEKFLKSVEQSDNKTPRIIKALKEVRNNKRMYLNKRETTMTLSLKLKPKKSK